MNPISEFILTLLHAVTNTHIIHWQCIDRSYAEHQALGAFYALGLTKVDPTMIKYKLTCCVFCKHHL